MRYSKPIKWILGAINRLAERYGEWYCWRYLMHDPSLRVVTRFDMRHWFEAHAEEVADYIEKNNAVIEKMKRMH